MFHYEIDCNRKVLEMLESVPVEQRKDPLFQRAIAIVDHVVVSRDNWLKWEFNEGKDMDPWYDPNASLEALKNKTSVMHEKWLQYLEDLDEAGLIRSIIVGLRNDEPAEWDAKGQILQFVGHAHYHRGQVALIVDMLGGKVLDTDYLFYAHEVGKQIK